MLRPRPNPSRISPEPENSLPWRCVAGGGVEFHMWETSGVGENSLVDMGIWGKYGGKVEEVRLVAGEVTQAATVRSIFQVEHLGDGGKYDVDADG